MNTLCHLALGGADIDHVMGQFLGDFVKGPVEAAPFPPGVRRGIRAHRRVDAAGDVHPFTRAAKSLLPPRDRRYGGIVLDLLCDGLLHRNWSLVMPYEKSILLEEYNVLLRNPPVAFPPEAQRYARLVVEHDLLRAYADPGGIREALRRIGQRLKRPVDLSALLDPLLTREAWLHEAFPGYFEDMRRESGAIQRG